MPFGLGVRDACGDARCFAIQNQASGHRTFAESVIRGAIPDEGVQRETSEGVENELPGEGVWVVGVRRECTNGPNSCGSV